MQQVEFKCPRCAAVFKAPASLEGESGDCPKCKAEIDRWPAPVTRPVAYKQPAAPPPPDQQAVWYYMAGDKRRGPVTEGQLKSMVEGGSLRPTDMVWRDGMPNWVAAAWLPGLFPQAPQPPALVPAGNRAMVAVQPPPAPVPPQYQPPPVQAMPVAHVESQAGRDRDTMECPFCAELISNRAKRCPVCGETVDVAMRAAEEARREAKEARREADRRPRRDRREVHYHHQKPTCPHALHLILTIFTLGFWLPIWIIHWIVVEAS